MTLSRDNPLTLFQAVHDTARIVIKKLDAARVGYEDLRSWEPKHNGMQTRSGLYFRLENGFPDTIIMPWGEWTYVKIASCTKYETLVKSILGALSCELHDAKDGLWAIRTVYSNRLEIPELRSEKRPQSPESAKETWERLRIQMDDLLKR